MEPFASLAPGLLLRSGDVPECGLLLVDLLVDSLGSRSDTWLLQSVTRRELEQLLISGRLCLDLGLKLIRRFFQLAINSVGLCLQSRP